MYHHVLFLLAAHCIVGSVAQSNTTIDDGDSRFIYSSGWTPAAFSSLDYGGGHHVTNHDDAVVTLTFTGIAVYFMAPLWPYPVATRLQLDSQPNVTLNLEDPTPRPPDPSGSETVAYGVIWSSGVLPNTVHTIKLFKEPTVQWAVVDAITYTVQDPSTSSSSTQSTTGTTISSTTTMATSSTIQSAFASSTNPTSSSKHIIAIAVGAAIGFLLFLLILAAIVWLLCRRKRRPESEDWTTAGSSLNKTSSPPGPLPPQESTHFQHPYGNGPNTSWTGSTPQMSTISAPIGTNTRPDYQVGHQSMQDFDPYAALVPTPVPIQHPSTQHSLHSSGHHVPIPLSTIAEQSALGISGSNSRPLLASPPSPSTDLSFYAPSQTTGSAPRLSYTSDTSAGASIAGVHQHQRPVFPGGSTSPLRSVGSSNSTNDAGPQLENFGKERMSLMAVNRSEDDSETSRPPAYTPN